MSLARLYVILDFDAAQRSEARLYDVARDSAAAGARLFQWRAKGLSGGEFYRIGREVVSLLASYGAHCLVNDRADVARALGAAGVHRVSDGLPVPALRHTVDRNLVGVSCHNLADITEAAETGADFVTLSPIYEPSSKPGYTPLGLEILKSAPTELPVFALGGLTPERAAKCVDHGAWGVAVMSGIVASTDAYESTLAFRRALGHAG